MTTSTFDLKAFCKACMDKQNENGRTFKGDHVAERKANDQLKADFASKLFTEFGADDFSETAKDAIFHKAWEDGHSSGYYSVAMELDDLIDFARIIRS